MDRRCILSIAVAFLLGMLGLYLYQEQTTDGSSDFALEHIKEARQRNADLITENVRLSKIVEQLYAKSDSLSGLLQNNRKEIIELENERNKKVRAIGDYSNLELYRFFARFETDSIHRGN